MSKELSFEGIPIFVELRKEELDKIKLLVSLNTYPAGEVIFKEGVAGDAFYVLYSGEVKISKLIDKKEEREKVLAKLSPGEFFGEMALFDDRPRSASAVATVQSKVLLIKREDFKGLLKRETQIASSLLSSIIRIISGRLRETNLELVTIYETGKIVGSVHNLDDLIWMILLRVAETIGAEKGLFLLTNEVSAEIEVKASLGIEESALKSFPLSEKRGILKLIMEENQSIVSNNFAEDSRFKETKRLGYEDRHLLGVPLRVKDKTIGAILLSKKSSEFTSGNLILLSTVASQVANAISYAQMKVEEEARQRLKRVYIKPF